MAVLFIYGTKRDSENYFDRVLHAAKVVNRYVCAAELAKAHGIQVQFVIMNPSTYLYLDGQQFCDGQCLNESDLKAVASKYNNYRYGLEELNTKMRQIGKDTITERMATRCCHYFGGTADTLETYLDVTLPAMQQGVNRYERFKNYRTYLESFLDKRWIQNSIFREIPDVGHSSADMMASPVISEVFFR